MPGSKTTPGRPGARASAPVRSAFRLTHNVGTRDKSSFAAQWLAYTHPCRRFTLPSRAEMHGSGPMRVATPSL